MKAAELIADSFDWLAVVIPDVAGELVAGAVVVEGGVGTVAPPLWKEDSRKAVIGDPYVVSLAEISVVAAVDRIPSPC